MFPFFPKKLTINEMRGSATPIFKHNIAKYCIISELNINTPDRWITQADKAGFSESTEISGETPELARIN